MGGKAQNKEVIIDGQQRITALSATVAKDPKWISDISIFNQPGFNTYKYINKNCERFGMTGGKLSDAIQKLMTIHNAKMNVIDLVSSFSYRPSNRYF